VTNPNPASGTSSCTLQLHGVTVGGQSQVTFTVSAIYSYSSPGNKQALQTGYATLQCSSKVDAQLLYAFYGADGTPLSQATVFSSPPATSSRLAADYRSGTRLALAIANDSNQSSSYTIIVQDSNATILSASSLTLAAGQTRAAFVDELTTIPQNFFGYVDVIGNNGSASVIGLRFTGNVFTTIPAATIGY
jgi:hypothetical protein